MLRSAGDAGGQSRADNGAYKAAIAKELEQHDRCQRRRLGRPAAAVPVVRVCAAGKEEMCRKKLSQQDATDSTIQR